MFEGAAQFHPVGATGLGALGVGRMQRDDFEQAAHGSIIGREAVVRRRTRQRHRWTPQPGEASGSTSAYASSSTPPRGMPSPAISIATAVTATATNTQVDAATMVA